MSEQQELSLEDYQKYFVIDDVTGDLFIRTDFKEQIKNLKGNKLLLLMKIMYHVSGDDEEEYTNNIKIFENGQGMAYETRKEYNSMRNVLMDALITRDGNYCRACGTTQNMSIDHIIPVVKGGRNVMSNLQLLCRSCNSKKGAK